MYVLANRLTLRSSPENVVWEKLSVAERFDSRIQRRDEIPVWVGVHPVCIPGLRFQDKAWGILVWLSLMIILLVNM